jgi:hypothetical protein
MWLMCVFDGRAADDKRGRNLGVGETRGDQLQDLDLACGQVVG